MFNANVIYMTSYAAYSFDGVAVGEEITLACVYQNKTETNAIYTVNSTEVNYF